jgi:hypothetical protein
LETLAVVGKLFPGASLFLLVDDDQICLALPLPLALAVSLDSFSAGQHPGHGEEPMQHCILEEVKVGGVYSSYNLVKIFFQQTNKHQLNRPKTCLSFPAKPPDIISGGAYGGPCLEVIFHFYLRLSSILFYFF